jgi:hypothetical protein
VGDPEAASDATVGRNHVDERRALVRDRRFGQWDELRLVVGKTGRDKGRAQLQRQQR